MQRTMGRWLAVVVLVSAACSPRKTTVEQTTDGTSELSPSVATPSVTGLERITSAREVCMVNDRYMGTPQIPVEVEGRTYYGCCAMCEGRLARDPSARTGVDPLTHRPVDKAAAVMGRLPDGAILYFEDQASFAAYASGQRSL